MNKPPNIQSPLCIDDYGEAVYRCFHTGHLVWASKGRWVGSILPQCASRDVAGGEGWEDRRKESIRNFNDTDKNCNTCLHLQRVKHPKSPLGFLEGLCLKKDNIPLKFHPHDCMWPTNDDCYEQR